MEDFIKLRNIALPLSSDSRSSTPLSSKFHGKSDLNAAGNSISAVKSRADFEEEGIDLKFLSFADELLPLDNSVLNSVLEDIDARHMVNIQDPKTEEVVTATETLVTGILHAAGDIDPRFKSSCIYSGSFYDDLKVGNADEFDFVARIDSLSQKDVLEARVSERKRGFVYLVVKDKAVKNQFEDFLTNPDDDPCLDKTDMILNVNDFQDYFIELIYSAIKTIEIPDNFIPTVEIEESEVSKGSWQPMRHGPCATLYLTYICDTTSDVVNIDIDIAPSIAYPGSEYQPPVIEQLSRKQPCNKFLDIVHDIVYASEVMLVPFHFDYTEKSSERSWHYHYSDTWRVSHSSIEKAIFCLFKSDDTEKKLCRILKILKEIYLQGTSEIEQESNSRPLKLLEPPSTRLTSCTVEAISGFSNGSEYETDSELEIEEYEASEDDEIHDESSQRNVDEDGLCMLKLQDQSETKCDADDSGGSPAPNKCDTGKMHKSPCPLEEYICNSADQMVEIIYSRVPQTYFEESSFTHIAKEKSSRDESDKATDENKTRSLSYSIDQVMNSQPDTYTEDQPASNTSSSPTRHPAEYRYVDEGEPCQLAVQCSFDQTLQNVETHPIEHINYRDSKPLLKTYMIKMLFFAMKTAYPDTESWKPDRLSHLLKMALCMIYYAYSSEEKDILNYWFQDLIENRIRDSTRTEILFCLKRLVHILDSKIQNCSGLTYK